MRRLISASLAITCALSGLAIAQDAASSESVKDLTIGDKAPSVKVAKYYKGKPLNGFESGKAYVMEFWATWCGPCIAQIPHLSKMQKTYKDRGVQFVSTAIWQREETQADKEAAVGAFVEKRNKEMQYTVAIDDDGWMAKHWMEPAGQNGIPSAFLVGKEGHIEWIGHPASLDGVLEAYMAGTWDRAAAKATFDEELRFAKLGRKLSMEFMTAERSGDRKAAAAALQKMADEFPNNLNVNMMQFGFYIGDPTTAGKGYAIGRSMVEKEWDNPGLLNAVAWMVVDDESVARRDLDFALKVATRADELTKHEDASILDTLARVYWEKGDRNRAVELQTQAIESADERMKPSLEATLASYQSPE
ncbi:MAG: redoxin family protein [Phycisphaerales bacterium]|nr:redoxin family protein [Phycisphaerales bacterium]